MAVKFVYVSGTDRAKHNPDRGQAAKTARLLNAAAGPGRRMTRRSRPAWLRHAELVDRIRSRETWDRHERLRRGRTVGGHKATKAKLMAKLMATKAAEAKAAYEEASRG